MSTAKETFRVGKRQGQHRWQIKRAPGWHVADQCDTLEEAAAWLTIQGADLSNVPVLSAWPWSTLAEEIRKTKP